MATEPDRSRHNTAWTPEDERRLVDAYSSGANVEAIANALGRTKAAVVTRLVQRGLLIKTPDAYWRAVYFCNFKDLKESKCPPNKS